MNCPQDWPEPIVRVQSLSENGVVPDRYIKPPTERPSSDHPTHANIPIIDFQPLLSSDNGDDELRAKLGRVPDPPNVEMAQPADEEMGQPPTAAERVLDYWANILALFCSSSAIEMALLSVESGSELPAIFYFLGFTLILGFTCFFVGRCIRSLFEQAAQVLERVGIFFGVTAIFICITIPFPALWFKCVTGFIYALCWLTILACYFHSYLLRVCNKVLRVYNKLTELLDIDRRNKIPSQISSQTLKILGWDSSSARSLGSEIIHVEQQQRSNSDSFFDIRQIGTRCRELLLESML